MILQLLVALAETVVWLHVAGSWAGLEGAGLTHVSGPSVLRHVSLPWEASLSVSTTW